MIVHADGSWERAEWHTAETYPNSYFIDESTDDGKALADKIAATRYYDLLFADNELVDIIEREPTAEEIEASKPQKSAGQIHIEQLEDESAMLSLELINTQIRQEQTEAEAAMLALELINTQIRLEQAETEQANLLLELVGKGVL